MEIFSRVADINLYAGCMLVFLYFAAHKNMGLPTETQRCYQLMILVTFGVLVADSLGEPNQAAHNVPLVLAASLYAFLAYQVILWLAYRYLCGSIRQRGEGLRSWSIVIGTICLVQIIVVFINQFTGWYYYIDGAGFYRRGVYYDVYLLSSLATILLFEVMLFCKRKYIAPHSFYPLLFFLLPPLVAAVLMYVTHTPSFVGAGIAFSLVVIFISTQGRNLEIDYLTQVYNRSQLDTHLDECVREALTCPFAAVMVDIDYFKQVNDTYGHHAGDQALKDVVSVLQCSLHHDDFIARYGGDEFCILLHGVTKMSQVEKVIDRIRQKMAGFNAAAKRPYQLSISMGYSLYDREHYHGAQDFRQHIDELMYSQKKRR